MLTPVFDIGGVLLDWDPHALFDQMLPDPQDVDRFMKEVDLLAWNREMDHGLPFVEASAPALAKYPAYAPLIQAFFDRWIETIPRTFAGTVEILEELVARGKPVYCITNFSAEHFPEAQEHFPFLKKFTGVIVSGRVKMLKPEPAIYKLLLDTYHLRPEETFFIDDVPENVEGARRVGMNAVRFENAEKLRRDLMDNGIL